MEKLSMIIKTLLRDIYSEKKNSILILLFITLKKQNLVKLAHLPFCTFIIWCLIFYSNEKPIKKYLTIIIKMLLHSIYCKKSTFKFIVSEKQNLVKLAHIPFFTIRL